MHRGLPCACCSTLGWVGPWADSPRTSSCGAGPCGSCGSATTAYTDPSATTSTRMQWYENVCKYDMQQQSLKCPSRNTTNLPQIYPILHPTVLLKPGISGFIPGVSEFTNPEYPGLNPEFPGRQFRSLRDNTRSIRVSHCFRPQNWNFDWGKTNPQNLKPF